MYEGLDWKSEEFDEEPWDGGVIYGCCEAERQIGVQVCQRGDQAIQGEKENAGTIEII